jgi:dihydrofolate synthase/folylpolyglutamate synthase
LRPPVFTVPNAPGHRAADPGELVDAAATAGLEAKACDSLEAGLKAAAATGADRILICGSLYLAGEVLSKNGEDPV